MHRCIFRPRGRNQKLSEPLQGDSKNLTFQEISRSFPLASGQILHNPMLHPYPEFEGTSHAPALAVENGRLVHRHHHD